MALTIFGRDVTKAVGTQRVGAPVRDPRAASIATALQTVSEQESMNLQPDPTLGAPFSSFPNNRLTVAQMGPGEPAENFPLGAEPRQWKYRVGWNFPTTPDTDRGIDGELLRGIADASWLVRRCIEVRKAELMGLNWEIVGAGRTGREQKENSARHDTLVRALTEWFRYPEGYYSFVTADADYDAATMRRGDRATWQRRGLVDWADWFDACLEDYFVGDWWSVWPQRTLGNEMLGLRRVDGQHIKALLDLDGRIPPPPMPAWQQYLYGVPRASWAADELYYWPRVVRNMTPYGYSHVQQALIAINLALKYDEWNTAAYTQSRVPMGLLEAAPGQTPQQLEDVADFLNGAVSTLAARQMVWPVPNGTQWQPIKPFSFDVGFAYYVIELVAACFDVQPANLGFAPNKSAGLGGKGWADSQKDAGQRKGPVPTARWIERKMTRVIQEQWRAQGGTFLEFRFTDLQDVDRQERYQANAVGIQSAQISLDALAEEQGDHGPGYGRILVAGPNVLFLDEHFGIFNGQSVKLEAPVPPPAPVPGRPGLPSGPEGGLPSPGTPPANVSTPGRPPLTKAVPATTTAGRRRPAEEAAFLAAWLLWWKKKLAAIDAPDQPDAVPARFRVTDDERNELARLFHALRGPVYVAALALLRRRAGLPADAATTATRSDDLRLQTGSQTHAVQVDQTYWSDLNTVYQTLLEQTQDDPDMWHRSQEITEKLKRWVEDRQGWKGEQIATTEATDAEAQAAADFATQNPSVLQQYRWRAVMDERTCPECAALDGQIIRPAQGPFPPAHPNCRCHLEYVTREPVHASEGQQPVLMPPRG